MLDALRKSFQRRLNTEAKRSVIVIKYKSIHEIFDLINKSKDGAPIGYFRAPRDKDKLSVDFKNQFVQTITNNCFITLYDRHRKDYFYTRCEPIIQSRKKILLILDSIFNKIISIIKDEDDIGMYKITSKLLDNYGWSYDVVTPFMLARDFQNCSLEMHNNHLSSFMAYEVAHQSQNSERMKQQLLVSKKFTNMIR